MARSRRKVDMSKARKRVRLADDNHVIKIVAKENPRREGTISFKNHADMRRYLSKKRGKATVKDVLANTSYRSQDLHYDKAKGFIKVVGAR